VRHMDTQTHSCT